MNTIEYIMVSNWNGHWDKLPAKYKNSSLFTESIIPKELQAFPKEASTLFIKRSNDGSKFEKSWIGKTGNFRKDLFNDQPAIRFDILELKETQCPNEFLNTPTGWHLANPKPEIQSTNPPKTTNPLLPSFIEEMETCDPFTFELRCFQLLRLVGIHDIHKFPQDDNRGKADGFFRFHSLSVIYDATLEQNFQKKKETQIENYIAQLKKEKIEFRTIAYTIKDSQKQVWIITRGKNVQHIKIEDHIRVKEIPYTKLVQLVVKRLETEIGLDELWDDLKDLH
ncbi:MAG: hypothetical protein K1X82_07210 [Bacteroidia bacterium]|nr:hypothetical protein [Bacteroidia bacterium]